MEPSGSIYGIVDGYYYEAHFDYTYDVWMLWISDEGETHKVSTTCTLDDMPAAISNCIYQLEKEISENDKQKAD